MNFIYSSLKNIYDGIYGNFTILAGIAENIQNFREFRNFELPFIKSIVTKIKNTLYNKYSIDIIPVLDPSRNKIYKNENELSTNMNKYIEWATINFLRDISSNSISNNLEEYDYLINKSIDPILCYLKVSNYIKDNNIDFNLLNLTLSEANEKLELIQEEQYASQKDLGFNKALLNKTIIAEFQIYDSDALEYNVMHDASINLDEIEGNYKVEQISSLDTLMDYGSKYETEWCVFNNESQAQSYVSGGRSLYLFYKDNEPFIMYTPTKHEFKTTDDRECDEDVRDFLLNNLFSGFIQNKNFNIETTCDLSADTKINQLVFESSVLPEEYKNSILLFNEKLLLDKFTENSPSGEKTVNYAQIGNFIAETIENLQKTDIGKQIIFKLMLRDDSNSESKLDRFIKWLKNQKIENPNINQDINLQKVNDVVDGFSKESLLSNDPMLNAITFVQLISDGKNPEKLITNINLRDYLIRNISRSCPAIEYLFKNIARKISNSSLSSIQKNKDLLTSYAEPLLLALTTNKKRFIKFLETYNKNHQFHEFFLSREFIDKVIEDKIIKNIPSYLKYINNMNGDNRDLIIKVLKQNLIGENVGYEQSQLLINQCLDIKSFINNSYQNIKNDSNYATFDKCKKMYLYLSSTPKETDLIHDELLRLIPENYIEDLSEINFNANANISDDKQYFEKYKNILLNIYKIVSENNLLNIPPNENSEIKKFKEISYLNNKFYLTNQQNYGYSYLPKPNTNLLKWLINDISMTYSRRSDEHNIQPKEETNIIDPIFKLLRYYPEEIFNMLKNSGYYIKEKIIEQNPEIIDELIDGPKSMIEVDDVAKSGPGFIEDLYSQTLTIRFIKELSSSHSNETYRKIIDRTAQILMGYQDASIDDLYENYNNYEENEEGDLVDGYIDYYEIKQDNQSNLNKCLSFFKQIIKFADEKTILKNYDVLKNILHMNFDDDLYDHSDFISGNIEDIFIKNPNIIKVMISGENSKKDLKKLIKLTEEYIDTDVVEILENIVKVSGNNYRDKLSEVLTLVFERHGESGINEILESISHNISQRIQRLKEQYSISNEETYKNDNIKNDEELQISSFILDVIKNVFPQIFNQAYHYESETYDQSEDKMDQHGNLNSRAIFLDLAIEENISELNYKVSHLKDLFYLRNSQYDEFKQIYIQAIESLNKIPFDSIKKIFEYMNI